MISTELHPWNPRLLWLFVPSLIGGFGWWLMVSQVLLGRVTVGGSSAAAWAGTIILGLAAFGLWLGSLLTAVYLVPRRSQRLVFAAIVTLPIMAAAQLSIITGAAAAVTVIGLWWGMEDMASDAHNRLTIQPHRTWSQGLPVMTAFILIAVSGLYYQQLRGSTATNIELTNRLIDQTATLIERFLPQVYPGYKNGTTVTDLISAQLPTADDILKDIDFQTQVGAAQEQVLSQRLEQFGLDPNQFKLDAAAGETALRQQINLKLNDFRQQAINDSLDRLNKQFSTSLRGDEPVKQALVKIIQHKVTPAIERYISFVPILVVVTLFLLLRIFSFIFIGAPIIVGLGFYHVLRSLHVLQVGTTTVPAQHLEWGR